MRPAETERCSEAAGWARIAPWRRSQRAGRRRRTLSLLGLDARGGDDLRPFRDFGVEELRCLGRRVADRLDADLVKAVLDVRLVDRFRGLLREAIDDLARRRAGRHEQHPGG